MTDNEIKKALEICIMGDCEICSCRCGSVGDCRDALNKKSLDLINRLQSELFKEQNKNKKLRNERNRLQAENEDKQTVIKEQGKIINGLVECQGKAIIAAYEECIEKLKEKTKGLIGQNFLDDFLKEMVGEDNA